MTETPKVYRVEYRPQEIISEVTREMSIFDFGVYWWICTLIFSRGEPILNDPKKIAGMFNDTDPRQVRAAIGRLIQTSKVRQIGDRLSVDGCTSTLQLAHKRIAAAQQNGRKGGRPSKENNDLEKGFGSGVEKLLSPAPAPSVSNKDSVPNGTALTAQETVWSVGLTWLSETLGKSVNSVRSFLGKACSKHGNDMVLDALNELMAWPVPPVDAASALIKILNEKENANGKTTEAKHGNGAGKVEGRPAPRRTFGPDFWDIPEPVGQRADGDADPVLSAV